jgi:hypothetical protein
MCRRVYQQRNGDRLIFELIVLQESRSNVALYRWRYSFSKLREFGNASGISKQVEDVVNVNDIVAIELHKRLVDGS